MMGLFLCSLSSFFCLVSPSISPGIWSFRSSLFLFFAWSSLHSFQFFQKVFFSLIGVFYSCLVEIRGWSCLLLRYQRCKNWKASLCSNIQFFDMFLYVWGKLNRSNAVCEHASTASTPCTAHYLKEETANVLVLFWANEWKLLTSQPIILNSQPPWQHLSPGKKIYIKKKPEPAIPPFPLSLIKIVKDFRIF